MSSATAAAWAGSIVAMLTCAGMCAGVFWRLGRREGKVDEILDELKAARQDHEQRLRAGHL